MSGRMIYHVGRREFLERVRSKAFIITTLLVPLFMVAIFGTMGLLARADVEEVRLVIVDAGTGLADELAERLEANGQPGFVVQETIEAREASVDEVRSSLTPRVLSDQIDGYLVLRPDPEIVARIRYYARETSNPALLGFMENSYQTTVLERWLADTEIDLSQIQAIQRSDLEAFKVSEGGEEAGGFDVAYFSSFALGMILYMTVLMHGQQMSMAIVEEKSSRLIELILGAVTATEFMAGKILGVLLTGLTQLGIWLAMGLVALLYALPGLAMGAEIAGVDLGSVLDPVVLAYFLIFFLLGYLLYATLMAAIASTCTSTQELGSALQVAVLPMVFALFFMLYAVTNPNTWISRVASFIPPFTPLVMFARVNVASPPWWEVWLGILALAVGAVGTIWLAAKIFRTTLLLYGKRPGFRELWRLVRAA